jgi:phosphoadenosine phosphosulfate reductase
VVILHLLHRLGALASGRVKVVFIDTLHLFPETLSFLSRVEAAYGFKAHTFRAAGCADRAAFDAAHGADLSARDIDEYDRICKVEPFARALRTLAVDAMLNGRRRDHGAERAALELWEGPPAGAAGMAKCQPLAYWEFRDCFAYIERHGLEAHPLHAAGYPSIGDAHSTVPVPRAQWFDYAGERSGRFVGLTSADGKPKTECGIHTDGAERTFERDLWLDGALVAEVTQADVIAGALAGKDTLLVVYAPWCPFCQKMEAELSRLAAAAAAASMGGLRIAKLRGDVCRDFARDELQVASFPTLLAFPASGGGAKPVKHATEERTAEALLAFVNAACGSKRTLPPGA